MVEAKRRDQRTEDFLTEVANFLRSEKQVKADQPPLVTRLPLLAYHTPAFPWTVRQDSTLRQVAEKEAGKAHKKHLSATTARDLQKHFQRGLGIRLGPAVGLSGINYQPGPARMNTAGGLLADWVFSPALSLETGALYTVWDYGREETANSQPGSLPGVDESLGRLQKTDIGSQLVQFPFNMKLYVPLFRQTEGVISGGYAFLLYLRQDLEYSYALDNSSDSPSLSLKSSYEVSRPRFYPGMVQAAVGTSTLLKNKARLEFSLYYQYGLGKTGVEQSKATALGLRTSYWFTVR